MATFFFETITDAQAAAYNATTDTLVFGQTGERANITTVRFNPATATSAATITLISGLTGKSVTFAGTLAGETPIFPDGTTLYVGTTNPDAFDAATVTSGSTTSDGLYGGDGNDSLSGGSGNDLLQG